MAVSYTLSDKQGNTQIGLRESAVIPRNHAVIPAKASSILDKAGVILDKAGAIARNQPVIPKNRREIKGITTRFPLKLA
jgi:hypothetical protein